MEPVYLPYPLRMLRSDSVEKEECAFHRGREWGAALRSLGASAGGAGEIIHLPTEEVILWGPLSWTRTEDMTLKFGSSISIIFTDDNHGNSLLWHREGQGLPA